MNGLKGIRILSFNHFLMGPLGVQHLADCGADVIAVEPVDGAFQRKLLLDVPEAQRIPAERAFEAQEAISDALARQLATRPSAGWLPVFEQHRVWHAPVNGYAALVDDPQVRHLRSFETVAGATGAAVTLVGHPVRYNGEAPGIRTAPPRLGADSIDILTEAGLTQRDIEALLADGVISVAPSG